MNEACHLKETNFQGQKGHSGTKDQILHCGSYKQVDIAWSCPEFNPTSIRLKFDYEHITKIVPTF